MFTQFKSHSIFYKEALMLNISGKSINYGSEDTCFAANSNNSSM